MNNTTQTPSVQAARQLAAQVRERLNALATLLMCGTPPPVVVLRLDDLAVEVTRAIAALAGVPADQALFWVAEEMLSAYQARSTMLKIHKETPGEAADSAEPKGGA